jgi:ubiquinone/menaquinone biosynthesis C-methylase UbiE
MWFRQIFGYNDYNRDCYIEKMAKLIPPGSRVLDAGAGTCKYKPLFSHCQYKAQDFAQYEGSEHIYGELDYVGDITSIPVADGSFDYIICSEVFEHIPRPDLAICEFARILRAGGVVILTAPLGSGIHMAPYHFYGGFTPFWYEHFLAKYGFELKECLPNGGFFKLYAQESQRFLSMASPRSEIMRVMFFPFKVILALWFRLTVPLLCYFLDAVDIKRDFTAGYFVRAVKL